MAFLNASIVGEALISIGSLSPQHEFISLTVNKYIISLKLNKYNSLKLRKYTVAGCKAMP